MRVAQGLGVQSLLGPGLVARIAARVQRAFLVYPRWRTNPSAFALCRAWAALRGTLDELACLRGDESPAAGALRAPAFHSAMRRFSRPSVSATQNVKKPPGQAKFVT